eukprot:Skav201338  [mRNA]  locus=scaffold1389:254709:255779:+ [translate_table: standard]
MTFSCAELSEWNRAISTCARNRQWVLSLQIFAELQYTQIRRDESLQADVILFSAAINACAEGSRWQEAFSILDLLKRWRPGFGHDVSGMA